MLINQIVEKNYQFKRNSLAKGYEDRILYLQDFFSENILNRGFLNLRYSENALWESYLKQKDLDKYYLIPLDIQRFFYLNNIDQLLTFCYHDYQDLQFFLLEHQPLQTTKLLLVGVQSEDLNSQNEHTTLPYILLFKVDTLEKKYLYQIANLSSLTEQECCQNLEKALLSHPSSEDYQLELVNYTHYEHYSDYDNVEKRWQVNYIALKNILWIAKELEIVTIAKTMDSFMQCTDQDCTDFFKFHLLRHLVAHESELWPEINLSLLEKSSLSPKVFKAALGNS